MAVDLITLLRARSIRALLSNQNSSHTAFVSRRNWLLLSGVFTEILLYGELSKFHVDVSRFHLHSQSSRGMHNGWVQYTFIWIQFLQWTLPWNQGHPSPLISILCPRGLQRFYESSERVTEWDLDLGLHSLHVMVWPAVDCRYLNETIQWLIALGQYFLSWQHWMTTPYADFQSRENHDPSKEQCHRLLLAEKYASSITIIWKFDSVGSNDFSGHRMRLAKCLL